MANTNVADVGTLVAETKAEITGPKAEDKVKQLIQNPPLLNLLITAYEDSFGYVVLKKSGAQDLVTRDLEKENTEAAQKRKGFESLLYSHGLDLEILNQACDQVYSCQDLGE